MAADWPEFGEIGASEEYPTLSRALYWIATIVFYGFGEEVGWRGFALPHLQESRSALRSDALESRQGHVVAGHAQRWRSEFVTQLA